MSWKFEPEDFKDWHQWENPTDEPSVAEVVSQMANAKLDAEREKMPVVYLNRKYTNPKVHAQYWTEYENDLTLDGPVTHRARLCDIEEIK